MKTAIYFETDQTQIILTPENEREKLLTDALKDGVCSVNIYHGSFYQCNGGWLEKNSLILNFLNCPGEEA